MTYDFPINFSKWSSLHYKGSGDILLPNISDWKEPKPQIEYPLLDIDLTQVADKAKPFSNIVFVNPHDHSDYILSGDDRLRLDLCKKLASQLECRVDFSYLDLVRKSANADTLYISTASADHNTSNVVRIGVGSDVGCAWSDHDFYFQPFYGERSAHLHKVPHAYSIVTLPSHIDYNPILEMSSEQRPVIAIVLRYGNKDSLAFIADAARKLAQRHGAEILVSTCPRTNADTDLIIKEFSDCADNLYIWSLCSRHSNPYKEFLARATHVVTSGTLSVTSDCLSTGKPTYYCTAIEHLPQAVYQANLILRDKLLVEGVVETFDAEILDRGEPAPALRQHYAMEWDRLGKTFAQDLSSFVRKKFGRNLPQPLR